VQVNAHAEGAGRGAEPGWGGASFKIINVVALLLVPLL
jgi:hypothetical protein